MSGSNSALMTSSYDFWYWWGMKQIDLKPLVLAIMLLLGIGASASASMDDGEGGFFFGGNILHNACKSSPETALGYVVGAYDAAQYVSAYIPSTSMFYPRFCSPSGSQTTQYRDIVCRFVDAHPEMRQNSAVSLTLDALSEAWPCK